MQVKHLIFIAIAGIAILLGFNVINGSRHEQNRMAAINSDPPTQSASSVSATNANDSADISSKPLGEQPKAIMDKATTQIDQAQQADKERLEQVARAQ